MADGTPLGLRAKVLLGLAKQVWTKRSDVARYVTEAAAEALDVERVSIWLMSADKASIVCEDLFRRTEHRHEEGQVLMSSEYPRYFAALAENRVLRADDARTDLRTTELASRYLTPLGITSMMDVPLWHRGTLYGVLCHEHTGSHRHWRDDEAEFAGNLADILAGRIEVCARKQLERRWTTVVESVSEAVFVLDLGLTIVQMNQKARELVERVGVGLSNEERHRDLEYRDQRDQIIPREQLPIERAAHGEHVTEIVEVRHARHGFVGWFRYRVMPVSEGDEIRHLVAVVDDVTGAVRLERLKSQFLAALAHELKTPVAIVKAYAQLLLAEPEASAPFAAYLSSIEQASTHTEQLIEDVVDIAALTLRRLSLARSPVDLSTLIASSVDRAERAAPNQRIRLSTPGRIELMLDPIRVEQVLRGLLDNAVRHSPPGADVDVDLSLEPRNAVVTVRDYGTRSPIDARPSIFDVFSRPGAGGSPCAAGLGITVYTAREIVRLHGGDIGVQPLEGDGLSVTLRLPREVPS